MQHTFIIVTIKRKISGKIMHKYKTLNKTHQMGDQIEQQQRWKKKNTSKSSVRFQDRAQKWQRWQQCNEWNGIKIRVSACEDRCGFVLSCRYFSAFIDGGACSDSFFVLFFLFFLYQRFVVWLFFDFQLIRCHSICFSFLYFFSRCFSDVFFSFKYYNCSHFPTHNLMGKQKWKMSKKKKAIFFFLNVDKNDRIESLVEVLEYFSIPFSLYWICFIFHIQLDAFWNSYLFDHIDNCEHL